MVIKTFVVRPAGLGKKEGKNAWQGKFLKNLGESEKTTSLRN